MRTNQEIPKKEIHLFGVASHVNDGDILRARVDSVEGHRRVTIEVVGRRCAECVEGWIRSEGLRVDEDDNALEQYIECSWCNGTGVVMND